MPHDVKTSLPQIDWQIGDTITITLDNPAATIVSLAIRVVQDDNAPPPQALPSLLAYSSGNA